MMNYRVSLVAITMFATAMAPTSDAQGFDSRASVGSVSAELGVGLVTSLAGGATVGLVGKQLGRLIRGKWVSQHDDDIDPFVGIGGLAGHVMGSALGVYLAGRRANVRESAGWTVGGALIGEAIGVVTALPIIERANRNRALVPAYLTLFFAPTIGATIAFNASRKRTQIPIVMSFRF